VRLPVVRSAVDKSTPVSDASMLSVVVPRGLAAAVLASIPFQQGISGGEDIQNIAYSVILISIILTSILVFLIDKTRLVHFYNWFFSNLPRRLPPDSS
jgi:NhaP-type Na+/H+ or K+/H+ antiporter